MEERRPATGSGLRPRPERGAAIARIRQSLDPLAEWKEYIRKTGEKTLDLGEQSLWVLESIDAKLGKLLEALTEEVPIDAPKKEGDG